MGQGMCSMRPARASGQEPNRAAFCARSKAARDEKAR
jgi:hypothetical protein